jgi:hypothetical protein
MTPASPKKLLLSNRTFYLHYHVTTNIMNDYSNSKSASAGSKNSRRDFLRRSSLLAAVPFTAGLEGCATCDPYNSPDIKPHPEKAHSGSKKAAALAPFELPDPAEADPPVKNAGQNPDVFAKALAVWSLKRLPFDLKQVFLNGRPHNGGDKKAGGATALEADKYLRDQTYYGANSQGTLGIKATRKFIYAKDAPDQGQNRWVVGFIIQGCILVGTGNGGPPVGQVSNCTSCKDAEAESKRDHNRPNKRVKAVGGGGANNHLIYSSSSSSSYWGLP